MVFQFNFKVLQLHASSQVQLFFNDLSFYPNFRKNCSSFQLFLTAETIVKSPSFLIIDFRFISVDIIFNICVLLLTSTQSHSILCHKQSSNREQTFMCLIQEILFSTFFKCHLKQLSSSLLDDSNLSSSFSNHIIQIRDTSENGTS